MLGGEKWRFRGRVTLMFIWFLPKSPRWLIFGGRDEQAPRDWVTWRAGGGEDDPVFAFEYNEGQGAPAQKRDFQSFLARLFGNLRYIRIIIGLATV